jgi:hypothetical protein
MSKKFEQRDGKQKPTNISISVLAMKDLALVMEVSEMIQEVDMGVEGDMIAVCLCYNSMVYPGKSDTLPLRLWRELFGR